MYVAKVSVRKFVVSLLVRRVLVIDTEMPLAVLDETMLPDELVLCLARGLMLAPGIAVVFHQVPSPNELLRMREPALVQLQRHGGTWDHTLVMFCSD